MASDVDAADASPGTLRRRLLRMRRNTAETDTADGDHA